MTTVPPLEAERESVDLALPRLSGLDPAQARAAVTGWPEELGPAGRAAPARDNHVSHGRG
jgi:hypothetical protein